ncbi:MAG: M13 family metallopeptidase N-terminal domain-containing protein, partial [Leuconostoc gelidum]
TKWQKGNDIPESPILRNFVAYHRLTVDTKTRDELGTAPVQPLIKKYQSYTSFADFASHIVELEKSGFPNALPLGVEPDFKDAQTNVLWAGALSILLPDTTYYEKDHAQGKILLAKFREEQESLLPHFGFSKSETTELIDQYLALDARAANVVLSQEENHEYAKLYHPYDWQQFTNLAPELPLNDILSELIGQKPDKIIVPEERFWAAADQFYSEKAWPLLKAYLIVTVANQFTSYLSDELRVLGGQYQRELTGLPEAMASQKAAVYLAAQPFNQAIGVYYAQDNFSPAAKIDVEHKVATMIDVFKQRLQSNQWLDDATRQKAVIKLNTIVPHIGYPEKLPE